MICPNCKTEVRDTANYCKYCGTALAAGNKLPMPEIIGRKDVKEAMMHLVDREKALSQRMQKMGVKALNNTSMLIVGNTGTGKTTLVNSIQKYLYSQGIIKNALPKIVDAVDFDDFSDSQVWDENIQKARGGILCIENCQKLVPDDVALSVTSLDKVFRLLEQSGNDLIIILTGMTKGFAEFLAGNPDIQNRFEFDFRLHDYDADELTAIAKQIFSSQYSLSLSADAEDKFRRIILQQQRDGNIPNGHTIEKKVREIFNKVMKRDLKAQEVLPDDIEGKEYVRKTYDEIMAELDKFVGIDEIKQKVEAIVRKLDVEALRKGEGAKREVRDSFLFLGNPGTGKTTIARVFADILSALDVLPVGQLVEVSRNDLVAEYVGQTAVKTKEAVDRAMGGILFIDEAYTLKQNANDSFGQEAIDTLLKLIEDNRGKFVAIAAGYTKEMGDFLAANSGMASRFNETVNFRDYNAAELTEIFRGMVKKEGLTLDAEADDFIGKYFEKMYMMRTRTFGNAREVRNVLNKASKRQAVRISSMQLSQMTDEQKRELTRDDIDGDDASKLKTVEEVLKELDDFVGMSAVKNEVRKFAEELEMNRQAMERGVGIHNMPTLHLVLTGNPGTGKTSVAKKLGEIFKSIGLLPTSRVVEKERKDLISPYANETAKVVDKACDEAMGGVLFIDEAYSLMPIDSSGNRDQTGIEAVEALMTRMVSDEGKFVVVMAGYKQKMETFIDKANEGFRSRFNKPIHIDDYTAEELCEIFLLMAKKQDLLITEEAQEALHKSVNELVMSKTEQFGNAREMKNLLKTVVQRKTNRVRNILATHPDVSNEEYSRIFRTIEKQDFPYEEKKPVDIDDCMKQLDKLIGLSRVKQDVRDMADYINVSIMRAKALGENSKIEPDHYVFMGNPGTGKTTVARIMADIFYSLGVLPSNKLVEVTRKDLVAGYVGQTASMTRSVVEKALGGVLFIDEAYSLNQGPQDSFGREAIDALVPLLLDYKGRMVCIIAGYTGDMYKFLDANAGLSSRFTKKIDFEDYVPEELLKIVKLNATKDNMVIDEEAETALLQRLTDMYDHRDKNFGNARDAKNLYEEIKKNQSRRISLLSRTSNPTTQELFLILAEDVNNGTLS